MSAPDLATVDGAGLGVALDLANELAVLSTEDGEHRLDAGTARRLAEQLTACADALDALQPDDESPS